MEKSRPTYYLSAEQQVAGAGRELDGETVKLLGDDDLAAETRGRGQAEGEIEHVLLVLARFLQQLVPFRIDDDVTGRAGKRAFAGALDIDVVPVRDFEHRQAERRVHLAARPV